MRTLLFSLSLALLSGCTTTLEQAISPEIRYGQLYALENALSTASSDCSDQGASFTATYWATSTVGNISDHSEYLEVGSVEQSKSKELVAQLYSLQYNATNSASHCKQISVAGNTTRELLALLSH